MTRGAYTWDLTVPVDGTFPAWQGAGDGLLPSLIQWDTPQHPSASLPETGIALKSLTGFHPRAHLISEQLAWLGASHLMQVEVTAGAPVLSASLAEAVKSSLYYLLPLSLLAMLFVTLMEPVVRYSPASATLT